MSLQNKILLLIIFFFHSYFQAQEYHIQYDTSDLKEESNINQNLPLNTFRGRFDFLNENTPLNIDYNDITYHYVKKYLTYKWYGQVIGLSSYYFPLFERKLRQYGMPLELKYLAVVESALSPRCISSAGAKGLWQFMPGTGRSFGLAKNKYVDIYFDPVANTDSAVRYLRSLYRQFKDWNLAISAYNCGAGNVRKAIRRAGTTNYWKVRPFLPKETQAYVPSFIAVNYMFNFYKEHNIKPRYFKYSFLDLKMIKIKKTTSFQKLSKEYNYKWLKFANPQFLTDRIPKGSIVYVKD